MHLRPVIARFATVACALALFAGSALYARQAMADGREGRRVAPPPPQPAQTYVPTTPDIPELAGGAPCLSAEEAYLVISQTTEGADIADINAALAEVQSDPNGLNADPNAPTLANELRRALGLSATSAPCAPVQIALQESVQLAQIASAAVPEGPTTGAIGEPPPLSPSHTPPPTGSSVWTRGHGYCVHLSNGCQG